MLEFLSVELNLMTLSNLESFTNLNNLDTLVNLAKELNDVELLRIKLKGIKDIISIIKEPKI